MEAVILAGGLGTRLASQLNGIPKPMVSVAGRPFLEYVMEGLCRAGCDSLLLSVGHLSSVIQDHFKDSFHGMPIRYVIESKALGTGGAIREALAESTENNVFVLNGDTFLPIDYKAMLELHLQNGSDVTMAISEQPNVARYGEVVLATNRVAGFREKSGSGPGWINAGTYVLPKTTNWPRYLAEKFSFETDFLMVEADRIKISAFPSFGPFLDIGIPEDLDRAEALLTSYF